jgi:hypothetical protein
MIMVYDEKDAMLLFLRAMNLARRLYSQRMSSW